MHTFFIMNPMAGRGEKRDEYRALRTRLKRQENDTATRIDTLRPGDAERFARDIAANYGSEAMVVGCGGDGTLHEIVNGLYGSDTALCVLPFGTGNDFAKKIYGREWTLQEVVQRFAEPLRKASIDLVAINDRVFLNVMSLGFDTKVLEQSRRYKLFGRYSYQAALGACLLGNKRFPMAFSLEGITNPNEHSFASGVREVTIAAICNASYYGNGFCPGPHARLDDGLLDFCAADVMSAPEIAMLAPRYAKGDIEDHPKIHLFRCTSGVISSTDGSLLPLNCDGELYHAASAAFRVLPHALKLVLPLSVCRKLELTQTEPLG